MREAIVEEGAQFLERSVFKRRARLVHVADDQTRNRVPPRSIVKQDNLLTCLFRAGEHVPDFEADPEAGSRCFGDEHVAVRQPFEIAAEHRRLGQLRLGGFDIVVQEMRGQHVVAMLLEAFADDAAGGDAAAIAANSAR